MKHGCLSQGRDSSSKQVFLPPLLEASVDRAYTGRVEHVLRKQAFISRVDQDSRQQTSAGRMERNPRQLTYTATVEEVSRQQNFADRTDHRGGPQAAPGAAHDVRGSAGSAGVLGLSGVHIQT